MARKVLKVLLAVVSAVALVTFAAVIFRMFKNRRKPDSKPLGSTEKVIKKTDNQPKSVNPKKKSPKSSRVLIALGCVCILVAVGIGIYAYFDDYLAEQRSQYVLEQIREQVFVSADIQPDAQDFADSESEDDSTPPTAAPLFDTLFWEKPTSDNNDTNDDQVPDELSSDILTSTLVPTESPKLVYDVSGVLSLTRFGLNLPVLTECNDSLLKVSPCRYLGSADGKPERLVIAGHNYKSHFGKLSKLIPGDEVRFTSLDGTEYIYTVSEITVISMDDHKALMQGEWDITLFTCTTDRVRRVLVRCVEKE